MTTKENCKVIKAELAKIIDRKNISVRSGGGTANHWIHINVTQPWHHQNCECDLNAMSRPCKELLNYIHDRISATIERLKAQNRIELSTFCSDGPEAESIDCILIQARFK